MLVWIKTEDSKLLTWVTFLGEYNGVRKIRGEEGKQTKIKRKKCTKNLCKNLYHSHSCTIE